MTASRPPRRAPRGDHGPRDPRGWPAAQRALRTVVVLGPVLALLAASAVGGSVALPFLVVAVLLALVAATAPDSPALLVADVVVVGVWAERLDGRLPLLVVAAAAALAASHLAAAVAASGPAAAGIDAVVLRRWSVRGVLLALAAAVVWAVALLFRGADGPGALWPVAVVVVALLALAGSASLRGSDR